MSIRKNSILFLFVFAVTLARMYYVAFYLNAGDPQRYIALAASAPNTSLFWSHFFANFDPFYWFFLYAIGSVTEKLLLPISALFFTFGYLSITKALNCSRLITLFIIILIMFPYNTMGNFISGALRQTFAMSLMLVAIFSEFSLKKRCILIICAILSHSSMILILSGYLFYIYSRKLVSVIKTKHIKKKGLILLIFLIFLTVIFMPNFEIIVNNKFNQYAEITAREKVMFGNGKLLYIFLHVLFVIYPYSSRSEGANLINIISLIVYFQVIVLLFVDTALSVRVFNSMYYVSFVFFCHVFAKSVQRFFTKSAQRYKYQINETSYKNVSGE